jgi:hypothetical protein
LQSSITSASDRRIFGSVNRNAIQHLYQRFRALHTKFVALVQLRKAEMILAVSGREREITVGVADIAKPLEVPERSQIPVPARNVDKGEFDLVLGDQIGVATLVRPEGLV